MPRYDMKTYTGRQALLLEMMSDPDLDLSFKEVVLYVYNWSRYEIATIRHDRACTIRKKYAIKLNESKAVFALRKNIKKL